MAERRAPPWTTWISPEGLVVLGAAAGTAAAASLPIVLVPGVLAYGIVTALRYGRWRDAQAAAVWSVPEPDVTGLAQPYIAGVRKIHALADKVLGIIRDAEPNVQAMLAASAETVKSVTPSAVRLARKLQELDRSLMAVDERSLAREEGELEARVRRAQDAVAKQGFERALAQQREKSAAYRELAGRRERLDAQLTNVELTLETVAAQVLRIKNSEDSGGASEGARIAEALDALSIEVGAAAETIDETETPMTTSRGRSE